MPAPPAPWPNMAPKFPLKNCSKGVPLNGLSSRSGPSSPGVFVMRPPYGLSPRLSCVDVRTDAGGEVFRAAPRDVPRDVTKDVPRDVPRDVFRLVQIRDTPLD